MKSIKLEHVFISSIFIIKYQTIFGEKLISYMAVFGKYVDT